MTALTVCVPVYNAASVVQETLEHIAAQTMQDVLVLVSIDRGDDASEAICRRVAHDRRFEVVVQAERLGWVGNVNALIARVETPFFCITPHDDLLEPRYLEAMMEVMRLEPNTSCAFSDIQGFGASQPVISQADVRGDRQHRVLDVLLNHYSAVAFRGVVRRRGPDDRPYLPTDIWRDFAADTAWMVRLALRGDLRRVAEPLYRKRYDGATVHAGWSRWSRAELLSGYASLVASCTRLALEEVEEAEARQEVLTAGLLRAAGHTRAGGWGIPGTALEIATVIAQFAQATADVGTIADPAAVLARTGIALLRDAAATHHLIAQHQPIGRRLSRKVRRLLGR